MYVFAYRHVMIILREFIGYFLDLFFQVIDFLGFADTCYANI